ncbi:MAG: DUF6090 family protein [Bacteroidota bacterium]
MTSFFRRIRQALVRDHKFSKYLVYAIGEIILVVIGILIALQINNWNESRKKEAQRLQLIVSLHADAKTTEKRLDFSIAMAQTINTKLTQFLNLLNKEGQQIARDTLTNYGSAIFQVASFRPALSSYETAVSTGQIALIANDSLFAQYVQFKDSHDWFKLHQNLSGDMVYLGNVWQLRKQLGSTKLMLPELGAYPNRFEQDDTQLQAFFEAREVYATFESMQWLVQNQVDALNRAKTANHQILATLKALQ